jgi:hypothetical protein
MTAAYFGMTAISTQYLAALFALAAAAFCIGAYFVPVPREIKEIDLGNFSDDPKPVDDLDRFVAGTTWQSRLNGIGGLCAMISAALQFWALYSG